MIMILTGKLFLEIWYTFNVHFISNLIPRTIVYLKRERERERVHLDLFHGEEIAKLMKCIDNNLILQKHYANFNQSWLKASLGGRDSSLIKWRATPFEWQRNCQYHEKHKSINQSIKQSTNQLINQPIN